MSNKNLKAYVGAVGATKLTAIVVMACILGVFAVSMSGVFAVDPVQIRTTNAEGIDQTDFAPEETVYIQGSGFLTSSPLTVSITRPGLATMETCNTSYCDLRFLDGPLASDANGAFSNYKYSLNGIEGTYTIDVSDVSDERNSATATFTDTKVINSVTLDGGTSTTVLPSSSITAVVNATITGTDKWYYTLYQIGSDTPICYTLLVPYTIPGTYTDTFTITAPLNVGSYDAAFKFLGTSGCGGTGGSSWYNLTDGINVVECGNGVIEGNEACDDNNVNNGDGCSSTCTIEQGWNCAGEPSVCTQICSAISNQSACEVADNCAWCQLCSGPKINDYLADTCYNQTSCYCVYSQCSQSCGAGCTSSGNCTAHAGGTCNLNTCTCEYEYHTVCADGYCGEVQGTGTNECTYDNECRHTECSYTNVIACIQVMSPGASQCTVPADCGECIYDTDCPVDYYNCTGNTIILHDNYCDQSDHMCHEHQSPVTDCDQYNHDFCNGTSWVHQTGTCVPGQPECALASSTGNCNDGLWCNGQETCSNDPIPSHCVAGTPVVCDDQNECTVDQCDDEIDNCTYTFTDTQGPRSYNVLLTPPFNNGIFNLTGTAQDQCSNISTSKYYLGTGVGSCDDYNLFSGTMDPADGSYDELLEDLKKLNLQYRYDGQNFACIKSWDVLNNVGNCNCTYFDTDVLPPDCPYDIYLDDVKYPDEYLICGNNAWLNATVCDSQSPIQGGEYFIDPAPNTVPEPWTGVWMNVLEEFIDSRGWHCAIIGAAVDTSQLTDGTHYIKIRGKDIVENWGKFLQCQNVSFIRDTLPPVTTKQIIPADGKQVKCYGSEETEAGVLHPTTNGCYYVKQGTQVVLHATDPDPQQTGEHADKTRIQWKVWYKVNAGDSWVLDQQGVGAENTDVVITLNKDSYHLIEYWSVDACGWEEAHHFELDIVDTVPPVGEKIIGEPKITCEQGQGCDYWVRDHVTTITLDCIDPMPHPVDNEKMCYRISFDQDPDGYKTDEYCNMSGGTMEGDWCCVESCILLPYTFTFQEDSLHDLQYYCEDALGNTNVVDVEYFKVDSTPPTTVKTYGLPLVEAVTGGYPKWINSSTPVTLTAVDGGDICHVGVNKTYWRNTLLGSNEPCENPTLCQQQTGTGPFVEYTGPFYKPEDSCHLIEYWSVDSLGNAEGVKKQCVYVDNNPPISTKTVGTPKKQVDCSSTGEGSFTDGCYYINQSTPITLSCNDQEPHPVDNVTIFYKSDWKNESGDSWELGSWIQDSSQVTFYYGSDSYHRLTWYCIDALGNKEADRTELDIVDTQKPVSYKTLGLPQHACIQAEENQYYHSEGQGQNPAQTDGCYFINKSTSVTITCADGQPHPVDNVTIWYRTYFSGDNPPAFIQDSNSVTFNYDVDSAHVLEWYCVDALGNTETTHVEYDIVDSLPPVGSKEVGDPKLDRSGIKFTTSGTGTAGWSTEQTHSGMYSIKMTTPNPSGNDQGRATLPFSGNLVSITSFNYWSYVVNAGTEGQLSIWASFYLDGNGDGVWNYSDYYLQCEPYYTYGYPTLNAWQNYDVMSMKCVAYDPDINPDMDCPHDSPTLAQYISGAAATMQCPGHPGWGNFASREYGSLPIIKIDMRAGYGGPWPGFVGYMDDLKINEETSSEPTWWVRDHVTPITLDCTDGTPHPVDHEEVCYKISFDNPATPWLTTQYCTQFGGVMNAEEYCCADVSGTTKYTFDFTEDSVHDLEFYCVDKLENKNQVDIEYFRVDSVPPEITKVIEGPYYGQCPPNAPTDVCFLDGVTNIIVNTNDPDPTGRGCNVGGVYCEWGYYLDDNYQQFFGWYATFPVHFPEETKHELHIRCWDALGNPMTEDVETFYVDKTPPVTTKSYIGPQYLVTTEKTDGNLTNLLGTAGNFAILAKTAITDVPTSVITGDVGVSPASGTTIGVPCAEVNGTIYSVDAAGPLPCRVTDPTLLTQAVSDMEAAYTDLSGRTPDYTGVGSGDISGMTLTPGIYKWTTGLLINTGNMTGDPNGVTLDCGGNASAIFIFQIAQNLAVGSGAKVTLSGSCQASNVYWVVAGTTTLGTTSVFNGNILAGPGTSTIALQNGATLTGRALGQTDVTLIANTISLPATTTGNTTGNETTRWITSGTNVTLSVDDAGPHKSGIKETKYRVTLMGGNEPCANTELCQQMTGSGDYQTYTAPFTIAEDSCHLIEYYSVDNVNKTETVKRQCVFVDNKPPVSTKTFDGLHVPCSQLACANQSSCDYYINKNTKIILSCTDQEPHPVDNVTIYYRYFVDDVLHQDWTEYTGPIQYNEDSKHTLEWYCEDALGNRETTYTQVERVDTTPPVTTKTIGQPQWQGGYWVTSQTPITLTTVDGQYPCAAGPATLYYEDHWDNDCDGNFEGDPVYSGQVSTDGNCNLNTTIYLSGECLHELRWHAVDALGNVETEHVQQHKVDNTPPHILILKPVDGWYSDGEDIPIVSIAEDLDNKSGPCEGDCYGLGTECAVGIADGTQCEAYLLDILPEPKIVPLETTGTFMYNAAAKECQGYGTIPEESGIPDGIVILVVMAKDNLGNEAGSLTEIFRAILDRCGCDVYDMCAPKCIDDVVQDIIVNWNLPKIGIDNHAPVVTITAPSENSLFGGEQVFVSADVSDSEDGQITSTITSGTPCYITLGGVSMGTVPYDNGARKCFGTVMIPEDNDFPQGTQALKVEIADNAGNLGSASINVNVDTTKPVLDIIIPSQNQFVKGTIEVTAQVSDANLDASKIKISTDNGQTWHDTWYCNPSTYCYDWDTATATDGMAYGIVAKATDLADNTGYSDVVIVIVDNGAPEGVYMVDPVKDKIVQGTITLKALATDYVSGVTGVDIYVNSVPSFNCVATLVGGTWQCSFNSVTLSDGQHSAYAVATDKLGQTTTSASVPFIIDNNAPSAPVISIYPTTNGYDTDGVVTWKWTDSTDTGSGIDYYLIEVGSPVVSQTKVLGTLFTISDLYEGSHTARVKAVDKAGHESAWSSYASVIVDKTKPTDIDVFAGSTEKGSKPLYYDTNAIYNIVWTGGTDANLDNYKLYENGVSIYTGLDTSKALSGMDDGTYEYYVVSTDKAGWSMTSNKITVTVDTVAPTIEVNGPTGFMGMWTFTYSVNDASPSSGIDSVVVSDADTSFVTCFPQGWCMVLGGTYVELTVYDKAGNHASDNTNGAPADTAPPLIIYSTPSGVIDYNQVTLRVNTSEAAECYYSDVDEWNQMIVMYTSDSIEHWADLGMPPGTPLADGLHVYHVQCEDMYGNVMEHSKTIVFYVNTAGDYCYSTDMKAGWNTFFLPQLILDDINFNCGETPYATEDVLSSLEGNYEKIYYYNGTDWLSYKPGRPINDLKDFSDILSNPYYIKLTEPVRLGLQCEEECNYCGDEEVNGEEQCELPDTENNAYCSQATERCYPDSYKTQYRDAYGYCDEYCGCQDDNWGDPQCVFDECGAECAVDEDCADEGYCDTSTCECYWIS
jgi:cysteine-rich repeat protein